MSAHGPSPGPSRIPPLLAALVPAGLVLLLRFLQVRSSAHILYAGEHAGIGRLSHWLNEGTFQWRGLPEFVHATTYQWFAQGTSFLQVVALFLEPVFGRTLWAHWGAAALLEAAAVLLFAATITRISRPAMGLLAGLVVALPPNGVLSWNLMPYGNHNEFLWVPLGVAFWLAGRAPEDRRLREFVLPVVLLALGCVLYRANLFPAIAAVAVLAWPLSRPSMRRAAAFGVAVGLLTAGLFVYLGLTPFGTSTEGGLASFPKPRTTWSLAIHGLQTAWAGELPGFTQLFAGRAHWLLLILGVLGAGLAGASASSSLPDPRKRVALFAALWGAAALAVPAVADHSIGRYFVPGWYAATLALATLFAATSVHLRRGAVVLFVAFGLIGASVSAPWIDRSTWSQTAALLGIPLWFDLEVSKLDLDELPFYVRILDEGRASPWVGLPSHYASAVCPSHPGAGPNERPEPHVDGCSGWPSGGLVQVLEDVSSRFEGDLRGRDEALRDVGRGAWIRSNRSLEAVEEALEGTPEELATPLLAGARDEAERWPPLGR